MEEELDSDEDVHVDLVVPLFETHEINYSLIQCFIYSFKAFITDLRCFLKKIMLIFNKNLSFGGGGATFNWVFFFSRISSRATFNLGQI